MLPRDETAFFGRATDLAEIERRFSGGSRLVTLVGFAGIGKTRLAIVAGAAATSVVFAPLGAATSLEAAVRDVAAAAGVRLKSELKADEAADALAGALAKKGPLLLVLDDVAHEKELVPRLLAGTRELKVLATAREPLGVRGEEKIIVQPLPEVEAIALLRDRARASTGIDVAITNEEARALVEKLDRLPLAIELAASRLEILSPAELLSRLDLDLLADASGPSSQRTMRAALDGSWDLLSVPEREALAQSSVFAAPFALDAAEDVIVLDGGDVLASLEGLVRRSLVFRQLTGKKVRLGTYQTIRLWTREKLVDQTVFLRHANVHLALAEAAAAEAYGEKGVAALDTLATLLPELLAAFESTKESHPTIAARIVLALMDLLLFRSLFELRAELFDAGVDAATRSGDDRLLARSLVARARVTLEVGRMQHAEQELRRAIDLATKTEDDVTRAEATRSLAWGLIAMGRTDEASVALDEARAMHDAHGNARGIADTRVARGILHAFQGRIPEALEELRAALAIHVEQGDAIRQEKVLGFAGLIGQDAREIARGLPRSVLAQAPASPIEVLRSESAEEGERWQSAVDMYRRGTVAHDRGDETAAIELFDRAAAALEKTGVERGLAAVHAHAAAAYAELGDAAEAKARLARARAAIRDPAGELVVAVFAATIDLPARRAGAEELLARATRAEIATSELAVATRVLSRALEKTAGAASIDASTTSTDGTLVVGPEARWIEPPRGEKIDLVRYGPVRRLLDRLVTARIEEPGVALSAETLIEAGWPGERMRHTAGLLRVYSAIRRLRRMGLEATIVTRDDGYLLDPDAPVSRRD